MVTPPLPGEFAGVGSGVSWVFVSLRAGARRCATIVSSAHFQRRTNTGSFRVRAFSHSYVYDGAKMASCTLTVQRPTNWTTPQQKLISASVKRQHCTTADSNSRPARENISSNVRDKPRNFYIAARDGNEVEILVRTEAVFAKTKSDQGSEM
jgi:hypothetical protein